MLSTQIMTDIYPKCDKCKKVMYGYMNDEVIFWLCPPCGYFQGSANDQELVDMIYDDPFVALDMIKEKELIPIN
jgi:acetyl-CoA carboxylase beta subunit